MKAISFAKGALALVLGVMVLTAQAVPVLVFNNGTYVENGGTASDSASALEAALNATGNPVTTFTSITASGLSTALAGQQVLVIPEQANSALAPDLTAEAQDVIRNFVSSGGGLIIAADYRDFLNTLFGYNLGPDISGTNSLLNAAGAAGTAFAGGPVTIPPNDATLGFTLASLPATATSIYTDGDLLSTVTLFQYGMGQIVQLGYDFNNAAPLGTQDGGWLDVLNRAVRQVAGAGNPGGGGGGGGDGNPGTNVPEPGSLALLVIACSAGLAARRRR